MFEILATVSGTFLAMIAITVGLPALLSMNRAGPHERACVIRLAGIWSVFALALGGWVILGMYALLSLPEFWKGAYWGTTAVLWLGYLPALIVAIRASNRQHAQSRMRDAVWPELRWRRWSACRSVACFFALAYRGIVPAVESPRRCRAG
jgi:hypothetical protein